MMAAASSRLRRDFLVVEGAKSAKRPIVKNNLGLLGLTSHKMMS